MGAVTLGCLAILLTAWQRGAPTAPRPAAPLLNTGWRHGCPAAPAAGGLLGGAGAQRACCGRSPARPRGIQGGCSGSGHQLYRVLPQLSAPGEREQGSTTTAAQLAHLCVHPLLRCSLYHHTHAGQAGSGTFQPPVRMAMWRAENPDSIGAAQGMSAYTATSGTLSVACGRLSFTFGLKVGGVGHALWRACCAIPHLHRLLAHSLRSEHQHTCFRKGPSPISVRINWPTLVCRAPA